jgi:hypothetical protein
MITTTASVSRELFYDTYYGGYSFTISITKANFFKLTDEGLFVNVGEMAVWV